MKNVERFVVVIWRWIRQSYSYEKWCLRGQDWRCARQMRPSQPLLHSRAPPRRLASRPFPGCLPFSTGDSCCRSRWSQNESVALNSSPKSRASCTRSPGRSRPEWPHYWKGKRWGDFPAAPNCLRRSSGPGRQNIHSLQTLTTCHRTISSQCAYSVKIM